MRKAALFASGAQLLNAIYAIAPELFGIGRAPVSGQLLDQAFRWFIFVESLTLAVFFFLVFRSATLNIAGNAVRIVSLVAASTLIIENMLPTLGTIQGAIAAANNSLGWKYHPLNQFAYVLGPTIPTLEVISLVVFLLLVFSRSSRAPDRDPRPKASGVLSLASFAAATMSFIAVAAFLYSVIMAAQPIAASVFRLLLRFATLVSLLSFFFVFGVSQRRGKLSA